MPRLMLSDRPAAQQEVLALGDMVRVRDARGEPHVLPGVAPVAKIRSSTSGSISPNSSFTSDEVAGFVGMAITSCMHRASTAVRARSPKIAGPRA